MIFLIAFVVAALVSISYPTLFVLFLLPGFLAGSPKKGPEPVDKTEITINRVIAIVCSAFGVWWLCQLSDSAPSAAPSPIDWELLRSCAMIIAMLSVVAFVGYLTVRTIARALRPTRSL